MRVIPPTPTADLVAHRVVKRPRGGIFGIDLKKDPHGTPGHGLHMQIVKAPASQAVPTTGGIDGQHQKLGLVQQDATQGKSLRCCGQNSLGAGQKVGKFVPAPRARAVHGGGVQTGQRIGRHGRMTGAGSRGGAASAGRR